MSPAIDAPIWYDGPGGPMGRRLVDGSLSITEPYSQITYGGASARAGLYGGPLGTPEDQLVLLLPVLGFRSGAYAGYINSGTDASRTLLGVAPGAPAVFQIRAWDVGLAPGETTPAGSYEEAGPCTEMVYFGKSVMLNVAALGGGGTPPAIPAQLIGLSGFTIYAMPEPSTVALGIFGAIAGLMVFRRRS